MQFQVSEFSLFPTRLLAVHFAGAEPLNAHLYDLFDKGEQFRDGFDMHPDSLNLLSLAEAVPALARLREMLLEGVRQWLLAEGVRGPLGADMVLFSNFASRGDFTLVHNHNADLVAIYYVKAADYGDRPVVALPDPDGDYDYFAAEDGALILHDPRFNANLAAVRARDYAKVFPRPGLLLVFPGFLWHSVTPHLGDFRRLALSANFTLRWPGGPKPETYAVFPPAE
jgi:hypothetical protein